MKTKLKWGRQGFSLVEAMVTVVVLSIVGLSVASSLHEMFRQDRTIRLVSNYNELINEMRTILTDGPLCTSVLKGVKFANGPLTGGTQILHLPAPVSVQGGQFNNALTVKKLEIRGFKDLSTATACPGPGGVPANGKPCCNPKNACDGTQGAFRKTGFIYLETDFDNSVVAPNGMGTVGITMRGMYVPVYVDTDAGGTGGKVISCLGRAGDGPRQVCFNLNGTFNPANMTCSTVNKFP